MLGRRLGAFALVLALAACSSESRFNPNNWFGPEEIGPLVPATIPTVDPRPLIDQVTDLGIERTSGGIIVTVTGLAPAQGYHDAELLFDRRDRAPVGGTLTLNFRIAEPPARPRTGAPLTREVTAGRFLSNQDLAGVRTIRVQGARNDISRRR